MSEGFAIGMGNSRYGRAKERPFAKGVVTSN